MSDLNKGRDLYKQKQQANDNGEPDPEVTGTERGRQLWEWKKNRNPFESLEPFGVDVTPGGDAA